MNNNNGKNSNNNVVNTAVKQERQDEAEIRELAAKFVEANKAKMAIPQRPTPPAGQSMNILSFLSSDKNKLNKVPAHSTNDSEVKNIDEDSLKGRFGWTCMGKVQIPYIMRNGERYCAVRMVEMKVLNKWLNFLHQDLYNCTNIRSYYITEVEARLLNEINFKHCDYQFGREQFTSRDLIVRLTDANEFYQFLGHCYNKLVNTMESDTPNRCGFIRINRESVVPYTVYNDQKYVPLFYFEGETDNLKQRADKLEGWDLSYLKFCCKVQGIRNELFAHDSCSVISLNDIKNYFPPGTLFEDYWPKKNLDSSQLLISGRSSQAQNVHWTRQPTAPPITAHPSQSPKPATQAKTANSNPMHNVHVFSNYGMTPAQAPYHAAPQPRANSAVRATYPSATARHMRPATSYYGNMGQAPPPLVRSAGMGQYNAKGGNYMVVEPSITQNNYHQATPQSTYPPPPLLHMNGAITRYDVPRYALDGVDLDIRNRDLQTNMNYAAAANLVNQNPAHQASSRSQVAAVPGTTPTSSTAAVTSEDRTGLTNGRSTAATTTGGRKLISLPDSPPSGGAPYKMQKALVEGKTLPCINMKPGVYTELLVTLQDLVTNFFDNVPVPSCQHMMQLLNIDVYKANPGQMQKLLENGRCQNLNETVPLVQVRNVINFMPQLKYMISGMLTADMAAKRQRNS